MPTHHNGGAWHDREDEELGLTEAECSARLLTSGYNELPSAKPACCSSSQAQKLKFGVCHP